MVYRVHTKRAQLCLFMGDGMPQEIPKPDSMKNEPNLKAFRRMVRKVWNIKTKT